MGLVKVKIQFAIIRLFDMRVRGSKKKFGVLDLKINLQWDSSSEILFFFFLLPSHSLLLGLKCDSMGLSWSIILIYASYGFYNWDLGRTWFGNWSVQTSVTLCVTSFPTYYPRTRIRFAWPCSWVSFQRLIIFFAWSQSSQSNYSSYSSLFLPHHYIVSN